MLGSHQITNAALAVAACVQLRRQGVELPEQAIREGLSKTKWAGRLEIISREPLLLLDGAHNPQGSQALAAALEELLQGRRLIMVIGILADKAIPEVLSPILPLASHVIVTAPDIPRAANVEDVAAVISGLKPTIPVGMIPSVADALEHAKRLVRTDADVILCTGSLFTISEARAVLVQE
jgi:dihydrofolate synthase/folylpolyglutamate synthase